LVVIIPTYKYFGKISSVCASRLFRCKYCTFLFRCTLLYIMYRKNIYSQRTTWITIRNFTSFDLPRSHIKSTPWLIHLFIIIYNVDYIFFLLSVIMAEGWWQSSTISPLINLHLTLISYNILVIYIILIKRWFLETMSTKYDKNSECDEIVIF